MGGIFISYRREDSAGHAGRLFDHLSEHFGKDRVFMDVAGIEPGVDFVESIDRAVGSCDILIAVIGRDWLDCTDSTGRRRLDDPNDFIRIETATALKRGIRVIPVLVQGSAMPPQERLPDDLKKLSTRQSLELSDTRWNSDVNQLVDNLTKVLSKGKSVIHLPDKKTTFDLSRSQLSALLLALLILFGGGIALWVIKGHKAGPEQARSVSDFNGASKTVEGPQKSVYPDRRRTPATSSDAASNQKGPRDEILSRLSRNQRKGLEMLQQGRPEALGMIDQTLSEADEAANSFPDDARFQELKGYLLKDVFQSPASRRLLGDDKRREYLRAANLSARKALRLAPERGSAHNLMGNVLYFEGNCEAAIREYDLALRLNNDKGYENVISGDRELAVRARDSNSCPGQ